MWLLMQPRDYLSTFLLIGMIVGAVLGVVVARPEMNLPAFVGFEVDGKYLFPFVKMTDLTAETNFFFLHPDVHAEKIRRFSAS